MDKVFEEWKKDMKRKLEKFWDKKKQLDRPPIPKQRCPKCMKTALEFNEEKGCFRCTNCGFEYCVKKVK